MTKLQYLNVISLGAGKQSSYMLIQALEGKFKYKPDFAIFSDTGCEPKEVYDFFNYLKTYVKNKYNFEIITVSNGNLKDDIEKYVRGESKRASQIPLMLENGGIVLRQCTFDYKIAPMRRYLQTIRNNKKIRFWIGISLDEIERMKQSNVKYIKHYYPLIETQTRIDAIVNWYKTNNFREPMKSACLICPFHSDNYWKRFKKQFPDEFKDACVFDENIRNYPKLNNRVYLSKHRKPLRDINFNYENSLFPELIEECEGLCGL